MIPLRGIPVDPAIAGDIHASSDTDVDLLYYYYDGPLMWIHTLPDGRKAIVSWVDCTEERLRDHYHIYVYDPTKFEAIEKAIVEDNAFLLPEFKKADTIYWADWLMRAEDCRCLEMTEVQWDQLEEQNLPDAFATLCAPEEDADGSETQSA